MELGYLKIRLQRYGRRSKALFFFILRWLPLVFIILYYFCIFWLVNAVESDDKIAVWFCLGIGVVCLIFYLYFFIRFIYDRLSRRRKFTNSLVVMRKVRHLSRG